MGRRHGDLGSPRASDLRHPAEEGEGCVARSRAPLRLGAARGAATYLATNETHPLDAQAWTDFRPFFFEEPFAFAGRDAAEQHLARVPKLAWPVYFEAHFWNAFPIGATDAGDYVLAQVQGAGDETCPVFRYDHETGLLTREADSIAELVARARRRVPPGRARRRRSPKSAPAFDPGALSERSYWLSTLLRGAMPDDLGGDMAKAPSFTSFRKEKNELAAHPHLALYWLFAHAVLENRGAFAATASSREALRAGLEAPSRARPVGEREVVAQLVRDRDGRARPAPRLDREGDLSLDWKDVRELARRSRSRSADDRDGVATRSASPAPRLSSERRSLCTPPGRAVRRLRIGRGRRGGARDPRRGSSNPRVRMLDGDVRALRPGRRSGWRRP